MKNNKLIKIMVCILSLAAIIGVSLGITAFADSSENQSVEIAGYNVSYGGSVSIVYAVKSELNEGQYVKIKGSAYNPVDGTTETFSTKSYEIPTYDIVINGENFGKLPMFYTPGIPLKNMATVVTAEAVICEADGTETAITSGKVTYSVLEYLYQRQFMYAESNTPAQNELYELMLKTGEAVQAALNNYGADHTPSKYAYVNVSGGNFDGKEAGIVLKGDAITLTGNDAGFTVTPVSLGDDYAVEEGTPVTVANGGEYTVDGSIIVTVNEAEAFEFGAGRFYSGSYLGTRYDFSDESQMNTPEYSPGATYDISITDGIQRFGKTEAGYQEYIHWDYMVNSTSYKYRDGESLVFEADLMFSEISSVNAAFSKLYFRGKGGVSKYSIIISESNGKIKIGSSTYVNKGEWNNIGIVATLDAANLQASVDIYVNGVKTATDVVLGTSETNNGKAHLYLEKNETGSIYMDNVFTGYVLQDGAGEYFNSELSGKRYDFTDGIALGMYDSSDTSAQSMLLDGVNEVKVAGESSKNYVQIMFGNQDTSNFTNKCAVFEADIKFNNSWTVKPEFRFRIMGYDFTLGTDCWNNTAIYISKSGACLYDGRLYNLRIELYETETLGSFNAQIYLDGVYAYTTTLTGSENAQNYMLLYLNGATNGSAVYFDNIFFDYVDKAYEAK